MRISDAAFDLIITEEVTNRAHYEAALRHTEWPGEDSGVTIGIGYDLGQTDRGMIENDWRGRVADAMLATMLSASGITGRPAAALAAQLKPSIDIPWEIALGVHRERVVPRWEAKVAAALPNTDRLSPDCFGALVSLTFNRGASFAKDGERYREMRAIKEHMTRGAFERIPDEFRSMKRLWVGQGVDGLLRRRDAEADLFTRGLSQAAASAAGAGDRRPPPLDIAAPGLVPQSPARALADLALRILAAMEQKGHRIDRGPGEINIVYVEGMNPDGAPNGDEANKWNDLRLVVRVEDGRPRIVGLWPATTEPGRYYTENPINPGGAARIQFGQYTAWQVGMHRQNHEALVQTGGPVTVCRDLNKDYSRIGDKQEVGSFGINQHWGYDLVEVDKASAGCLVGQSKTGHREFMALVKSDPRYQADHTFVFTTAVLDASTVHGVAVAAPPAEPPDFAPARDGREEVRRIQRLLGFSEQGQDGIFGAVTNDAVKRFQRLHGLPVTGDVDDSTMALLVREAATIATPSSEAGTTLRDIGSTLRPPEMTLAGGALSNIFTIGLGGASMNPFVMIAAQILPEIIKAVAGDKAGTVVGDVAKAVTDVTRANTPEAATDKLKADPAAYAALQLKLAEIAAAQEEARQKAQLAAVQAQLEADADRRKSELQALQVQREDTSEARAALRTLAGQGGAVAWTAPVLSYMVTIGFFAVLVLLMLRGIRNVENRDQTIQVVNIVIGALTAAFATVVNFWLGSSQGSRLKDVVAIQREEGQAARDGEATRAAKAGEATGGRPGAGPKPTDQIGQCLDVVLAKQSAADVGRATRFGIALDDLQEAWRKKDVTADDLQKLTRDQAAEIYRVRYWNVLKCDDLPAGVDLVVFDLAAETDTAEAAKILQRVVGANEDGSIGPVTLGAVKLMTPQAIVTRLSQLRRERQRRLAAGAAAADTSRADDVESTARRMIDQHAAK